MAIDWDQKNVKNLSYYGELADHEKVLIESMAGLVVNKTLSIFQTLTFKECEAFLRDRNSELAIAGLDGEVEAQFKKLFSWVGSWPVFEPPKEYRFAAQAGGFRKLKVADKIIEIRAFLNSPQIVQLFEGSQRPQLVDIDDLTVYLEAPYQTAQERGLFEELHTLGVRTFGEESLNFIPDA